jgi:hypothetical protein
LGTRAAPRTVDTERSVPFVRDLPP